MAKKAKKLGKSIEGTVVKIKEVVTGKDMAFDFLKLPKAIQEKLGPFGLNHKLGDAAAGCAGQEAVDAIEKVFAGLMAGDWSVRAPRGESVSVTAINSGISKLPPKEAEAATALLIKLGIIKDPKLAPPVAPAK
jgi:hypothetical protein